MTTFSRWNRIAVDAIRNWTMVDVVAINAVGFIVLILVPNIDLGVSRLFYVPGEGFPLARLPLFLFLMSALSDITVGVTAIALVLGVAALVRKRVWLGVTPRIAAFLTLSLIIGPGLIVNTLFKDNWGRARPHQIVEFGGQAHFSPAAFLSDQCIKNCSFPSGHGALAFWLTAFALVSPPRWRGPAMAAALTIGVLIGAMRVAQGGHFLSDTIASALIAVVVNWILKILVLDRPQR